MALKRNSHWALLAKVEASYGAGGTVSAATDAVMTLENPSVNPQYVHDGSRNGRFGMLGSTPRAGASGRYAELENLVQEAHGAGSAYSTTVLPNVDVLMKLAGYSSTVTAGTSVTYTPTPDNTDPASGIMEVYGRGQKATVKGVLCDLEITVDGPGIPKWTFSGQGMMPDDITDASIPAITYPAFLTLPPKSQNIALTIGGVAGLKIQGWTFRLNRSIAQRVDDNSEGHGGYVGGERNPTLEIVVEASSLTSYNPYVKMTSAVLEAISFTIGATNFNKWTFNAPKAQLVNIDDSDNGPLALWTLTYELRPTTFGGNDDHTITFS